jgi:hypothetical protein
MLKFFQRNSVGDYKRRKTVVADLALRKTVNQSRPTIFSGVLDDIEESSHSITSDSCSTPNDDLANELNHL